MNRSAMAAHVLAATAALALNGAAIAGDPPKQLYNKTIHLSWSETNTNIRLSDGHVGNGNPKFSRTVYISSAGRRFTRWTADSGNNSQSILRPPGDTTGGIYVFEGNKLTIFDKPAAMVRKMTVTFDGSFSSCSMTEQIGKLGTSPRVKGVDGQDYQVTSVAAQSSSCSISEGNSFSAQ